MSVGVDIGKDVFHMVGFDKEGQLVWRKTIKCMALVARFEELPCCIPGMEACTNAHFVRRTLRKLILGLQQVWIWIDKRIEMTTTEIEDVSKDEARCLRIVTILGIGPIISTAVVAAVGGGKVYDRGRDFAAWLELVVR